MRSNKAFQQTPDLIVSHDYYPGIQPLRLVLTDTRNPVHGAAEGCRYVADTISVVSVSVASPSGRAQTSIQDPDPLSLGEVCPPNVP